MTDMEEIVLLSNFLDLTSSSLQHLLAETMMIGAFFYRVQFVTGSDVFEVHAYESVL